MRTLSINLLGDVGALTEEKKRKIKDNKRKKIIINLKIKKFHEKVRK
jgi:hypothetical protein